MSEWINVKDDTPKLIQCTAKTAYSETVIVWTSGGKVMAAVYDGTDFLCPMDFWKAWGETITHWMPAPKPPQKAKTTKMEE